MHFIWMWPDSCPSLLEQSFDLVGLTQPSVSCIMQFFDLNYVV